MGKQFERGKQKPMNKKTMRACPENRFEIIDDGLNILYNEALTKTRLQLSSEVKQKIVKGKEYLWTVEVYGDNGKKLASASCYFEIE
jgi:hypothetical protein